MRIELINTGTELMLGSTQNTHAAWFGRRLFELGLRVMRQTSVPDGSAIQEVMADAIKRADVLIVTGGLGPTSDDLTRETTANVIGCQMILDEATLCSIESFFAIRGKSMAESNRKQALYPVGSKILPNSNGTAPGIYVPPGLNDHSHAAIFLLPGPPKELYPMVEAEVIPLLQALSSQPLVEQCLVLKFTGVGESDLQSQIDHRLATIPDLEFGYCAHISEVDIRLIGSHLAVKTAKEMLLKHYPNQFISEDGSLLEEVIIQRLKTKNQTLACAESCTGGWLANRLTNIAGSSSVFTYGWVTYANQAKVSELNVSPEDIEKQGAVSEGIAIQMAEGALDQSNADWALSITGIAGPEGGSNEKPVGTAWIGLAQRHGKTQAMKVFQPRNRLDFKQAVSQAALDLLKRSL